jgi:uncharacterized membrane protein YeaQ/YmgE (transglycosylase-associated protein family)
MTWLRTIKIWWYWAWRSLLMALVVAVIFGFLLGLFASPFISSPESMAAFSNVAGAIIGIFFAIYVLKSLPEKRFSDFRVVLVPRDAGESGSSGDGEPSAPAAAAPFEPAEHGLIARTPEASTDDSGSR